MGLHLHRDLEFLKGQILDMGALVETAVNEAISALIDRRPEPADAVGAGDDLVDEKEVAIEIDCQKILALHQPVATDLRLLLTVLKINNDLERAGDLAVNIAERARVLGSRPAMKFPAQTERLVALVRAMLRDSLDAFVNQDTALAHAVRAQDEEVDELNRQMFTELERSMRADPDTIERALHLLSCSRHLERVADLATNIAEDVVFLVDGTVIRHRRKA
jgi:phosphate transport system protein